VRPGFRFGIAGFRSACANVRTRAVGLPRALRWRLMERLAPMVEDRRAGGRGARTAAGGGSIGQYVGAAGNTVESRPAPADRSARIHLQQIAVRISAGQ